MRPGNALFIMLAILAVAVFGAMVWVAGEILALFLIAFLLAYVFNPLTTRLARHGVKRPLAAALITVGLSIVIGALIVVLGPIIYAQVGEVLEGARTFLNSTLKRVSETMSPHIPAFRYLDGEQLFKLNRQSVQELTGPVAASVLKGGMAFATTLGIILLIPVVMFYLLKDWPVMLERVQRAFPPRQRPMVRDLGYEVDGIMSAFLRGQAWVCVCVAVLYSVGLMAVGLKYGLVIGVISGILKFLPYIGTAIGLSTALTTAFMQGGWDQWLIIGVIAVYLITEFIESSYLSPNLIGARVQMPPALVIFAVLFGAKLLGVIGVFIAVPAFAVSRAVIMFWIRQNERQRPPEKPPAKPRRLTRRAQDLP